MCVGADLIDNESFLPTFFQKEMFKSMQSKASWYVLVLT